MGCSGSKDESEARAANAGQKAEAKATPNGIVMKPESDILSDSTVQITLDANKTAAVKSLFGTWDIDSTGKLELAAFTGVVMKVGPHQTKILSRLTDMDIDKDGFVTKEEWLTWFTATAGTLNSDEFNLVMEEMQVSAEEMVTLVRCTRLAAESEAEIEAPTASPPLAGGRLEKVQALFKAWDIEGKGGIDRVKIGSSSVSFGPHKSHVLKQLESMDTDGDNVITLAEMTTFFQATGGDLSDSDFNAVIAEMLEVAGEAATIAACLELAGTPLARGADEDGALTASLSASRTELLGKLFDLFPKDKTGSVDVSMLDQVAIKEGPNETKLLTNLTEMDANNDGKVTFDEMKAFFAAIGATLNDEEFELIVGEMLATCESAQLATQLAALAGS